MLGTIVTIILGAVLLNGFIAKIVILKNHCKGTQYSRTIVNGYYVYKVISPAMCDMDEALKSPGAFMENYIRFVNMVYFVSSLVWYTANKDKEARNSLSLIFIIYLLGCGTVKYISYVTDTYGGLPPFFLTLLTYGLFVANLFTISHVTNAIVDSSQGAN